MVATKIRPEINFLCTKNLVRVMLCGLAKLPMSKIDLELERLSALRQKHIDLSINMLTVAGGKFFPVDLFCNAILNRSVCLLKGFISQINEKNFISAAPILRLQLDNLLRLSAVWQVEKPHDFASDVMGGEQINRMKNRGGEKMYDKLLVRNLEKDFPWVVSVYENTSGYVHFSHKHFANSFQFSGERTIALKISDVDEYIKEEIYLEAILAFNEITNAIFKFVDGWVATKTRN